MALTTIQDEEIKDSSTKEYDILIDHFNRFLDTFYDGTADYSILDDIVDQRALFALNHAVRGFGVDLDTALDIVRAKTDGLSELDNQKRVALLAAMDNVIEFIVASHHKMKTEISDVVFESDSRDKVVSVFEKYNHRYAEVENKEIFFSMVVASSFIAMSDLTNLTFYTQGDERVRDSHKILDGITYPKKSFPTHLIPPIDWCCRCYLAESSNPTSDIDQSDLTDLITQTVNPIFTESPVDGGRIFSDAHPYFTIRKKDKPILTAAVLRIKKQLKYGNEEE
ncbi:MAG: phage minor head protein [Bacteroidales bacterium]